MKTAVFPGSFDPVTLGHIDIIARASRMFDHLYVCIVPNGEKRHPMFSDEEKLSLMQTAVRDYPNVTAELWGGLLTDYAREKGAAFLVRGVRNATDFDAEYQLAQIYKDISNGAVETVQFGADVRCAHISSTMVREMIKYRQPLEKYVPAGVAELLKGKE